MFNDPVVDYLIMEEFLANESLILVVVLNNLRDFEIARLLGWYRIPLRSAPKVVSVDYLAFYQTAAFETEKWQISYIVEVRGHELATRRELLRDEIDHPRANQEYYKIQIGPLLRLSHPIPAADWRRITFLYTTGEYLSNAQTINDLVVHSEERQTLWKTLRERAENNAQFPLDSLSEYDIDPDILDMLLGGYDAPPNYPT